MAKSTVQVPETDHEFATEAQIQLAADKGIEGVTAETPFADAYTAIGNWMNDNPLSDEQKEERRKSNFQDLVTRYLAAAEARFGDSTTQDAPATEPQIRRLIGSCPGDMRPNIFGAMKAGVHKRQASAMIFRIENAKKAASA